MNKQSNYDPQLLKFIYDFFTERIESLVYYEDKAHDVYLHFSHGDVIEWYNVLFTGDFLLVAQSVDNFRGAYPVKGLILRNLEGPDFWVSTVFIVLIILFRFLLNAQCIFIIVIIF